MSGEVADMGVLLDFGLRKQQIRRALRPACLDRPTNFPSDVTQQS